MSAGRERRSSVTASPRGHIAGQLCSYIVFKREKSAA
jgi:hypothetical protein